MKYLLLLLLFGVARGELCSSRSKDYSFCGSNKIYDHTKSNVDCGSTCTPDHCCTEFTTIFSGTCEGTPGYYNPDETQCEQWKNETHPSSGDYKGDGWTDSYHDGAYSSTSHPPHCTTRGTNNGDTWYNVHHNSTIKCSKDYRCVCLSLPSGYGLQETYHQVSSGTSCEAAKYITIANSYDCKEALAVLSGIDEGQVTVTETPTTSTDYRKGCHYSTSTEANFVVNNPDPPPNCGTNANCICKSVTAVYKQCTCEGGTGATGTNCPRHGIAKCVSCNSGYTLDGTICIAPGYYKSYTYHMLSSNPLTTDPGWTSFDSNDVKVDTDMTDCESAGYITITDSTECQNSFAYSSISISTTSRNFRKGCHHDTNTEADFFSGNQADSQPCGYTIFSPCVCKKEIAKENQCTCEGGTGASGDACPNDGDAECVSCTGSRYLSNGDHDGTTCVPTCTANYVLTNDNAFSEPSSGTWLKPDVTETLYGNTSSGATCTSDYTDCYTLLAGTTSYTITCKDDRCVYPQNLVDPEHSDTTAGASVTAANAENPYRQIFMDECARGCKAANTGSPYMRIAFHRKYDAYQCYCHNKASTFGVTARTVDAGWTAAEYQCRVCDEECPSGSYQTAPCSGSNSRVCTPCSTCHELTGEVSACTTTSDRQCSVCGAGILGDGTQCTDVNECTEGTYRLFDADTSCADNGATELHTVEECERAILYLNKAYGTVESNPVYPLKEHYTGFGSYPRCFANTAESHAGFNSGPNAGGRDSAYKPVCKVSSACDTNAQCNNTDGSFSCVCNPGYSGDGVSCEDIDECASDPCVHGTCNDLVNDYSCTHCNGFTGENCDQCVEGKGCTCGDVECGSPSCVNPQCVDCDHGFVNNQTSHDAPCASLGCAEGFGHTSDLPGLVENGWNSLISSDDDYETTNSTCQLCPTGTHSPANDGQCTKNVCTCTNGTPAEGADCQSHGEEYCDTCNNGFVLSASKTCVDQVYGCTDSDAFNFNPDANTDDGSCVDSAKIYMVRWQGGYCYDDPLYRAAQNGEECSAASAHFNYPYPYKEGWDRFVTNSEADRPSGCVVHSYSGNYWVMFNTYQNELSCASNSNPFSPNSCLCVSRDMYPKCPTGEVATAVQFYTGDGGNSSGCVCDNNICNNGQICNNGACSCPTGFTGDNCKQCAAGYHSNGTTCAENQCKCANGTPAEGADCQNHDVEYCAECTGNFMLSDNKCETCNPGFAGENCDQCANGYYHDGTTCVLSCAASYKRTNKAGTTTFEWAEPSSGTSGSWLKPDVTETVYGSTELGECVTIVINDITGETEETCTYTLLAGTTSYTITCKDDRCVYPQNLVDPEHSDTTAGASVTAANAENPYRQIFMDECARGCKAANTGSPYMRIAFHRKYDAYQCYCNNDASTFDVTARTVDAGWTAAEYQCAVIGCTDPNAVNYDATATVDDGSCSDCKGEYYKNGDVCTACDTTCGEGEFISTACTTTENRVCKPCSSCPSGKFATGGCDGIDDTLCADLKRCAPTTPVVFKGANENFTAYTIEVGEGSSIGENVNFTVCKNFTIERKIDTHALKIDKLGVQSWDAIETKTFTADPGTYTYVCVSHPEMTGTITVIDCNPCVHGICHDNTDDPIITPGEFSCKTTDGVYDATGVCEISGEPSGFTGDKCDECVEGKGHNITSGKCEECADGYVNNVVSHEAQCALLSCEPGYGQTSDVPWVRTDTSNTTGNCIPCGEHEVSPGGQGQCVTCNDTHTPNSDHSECVCPQPLPYWDGEKCSLCPGGQKWGGTECVPSGCDLATPKWVPYKMAVAATENIHQYCWGSQGREADPLYGNTISECSNLCSDTPEFMIRPEEAEAPSGHTYTKDGKCYCMSAFNEQGCTINSINGFYRYINYPSPSEGTCEACPPEALKWDGTQCVAVECDPDKYWVQTSLEAPYGVCTPCPGSTPKAENNMCVACPDNAPKWDGTQCVASGCDPDKFWEQTSLEAPYGVCTPCPGSTPKAENNMCVACPDNAPKWDGTQCVLSGCDNDKIWNQTSLEAPYGVCLPCPGSTPKAENNVCVACPDNAPKWDGTQCVPSGCDLNKFWEQNSLEAPYGVCTPCPGSTSNNTIDNVCECPGASELITQACHCGVNMCNVDEYCNADEKCTECMGNFMLPDCNTCNPGFALPDCNTCANGFYHNGTTCVPICAASYVLKNNALAEPSSGTWLKPDVTETVYGSTSSGTCVKQGYTDCYTLTIGTTSHLIECKDDHCLYPEDLVDPLHTINGVEQTTKLVADAHLENPYRSTFMNECARGCKAANTGSSYMKIGFHRSYDTYACLCNNDVSTWDVKSRTGDAGWVAAEYQCMVCDEQGQCATCVHPMMPNSDHSECVTPKIIYHKVTSGTCDSNNYVTILQHSACEQAAIALEFSDTSVVNDNQTGVGYDPLGCYYESEALKINNDGNTGECSYSDQCLCSEVTLAPYCANQNGTEPNPECICDNTICDADEYCTEGLGCHVLPRCDNQNGTEPNTAKCQCGTSECNVNEFCNGELHICSAEREPKYIYHLINTVTYGGTCELAEMYKFHMVKSGTCESNNYSYITNRDLCSAAATWFGLDIPAASGDGQNGVAHDPFGCYSEFNIYANNYRGGYESFINYNGNTGSCSDYDRCLCSELMSSNQYTTLRSPTACDQAADVLGYGDTDITMDGKIGSEYSPLGCYYDSSLKFNNNGNTGNCSDDDQCFCGEVTSAPYCANQNGTKPNPECICDNTICGADQYCTEGLGCHAHPPCDNQDGTQPNQACQCGTSECSDNQYCFTDTCRSCSDPYEIILSDSYGDGWNGAYIIVHHMDGNTLWDTQMNVPSGSEYKEKLCDIQSITLEETGNYPGEISFVVKHFNGTEIYSSGEGSTWTEGAEVIFGCTDPNALNYNVNATEDDGSCECAVGYFKKGDVCTPCSTCGTGKYETAACTATQDTQCAESDVPGCTVSTAVNYDATATVDDGSCVYEGCTNPTFTEYDATATIDDGSCQTRRVNNKYDILRNGNAAGSPAAKTFRKNLLRITMRSKTRPATQSRKDFVKESRFELEKEDLSDTTKNRLTSKGKTINRVFHSMGPQNKDIQVTDWVTECANGDCCHIDFSNQTATDLQIIEPDEDVGSWVVACNGDEPQCMQTREANGFLMQEYDNGWNTGVNKTEGDVHQCGSNVVVIGSMEGICGSGVDCLNGGECVQNTTETYTCQCLAGWCGESCESAIPAGDCDCNGNQNDALGVCGGDCEADENDNDVCDSDEVPVAPAGPSTCPDDTSGLTAAEYINAQCCQCN